MSGFFSLHSHSRHSANDALPSVGSMVDRAVELGYPALGLSDHGNISGSVDLYKACRKADIEPLPGIEIYLNADRSRGDRKNYHLTINAYTETGYRNLVALNNQAQRQYFYKPMLDIADLAGMAESGMTEGLSVATGCYFGLAQQLITTRGPEAAKQAISALAGWFPRVYVELHNHGVVHGGGYDDASMAEELVCLADELGIPYIIALDAHYTHAEHQSLHNGLKGLVTWSDDPDEALFPGGPYSLENADTVSRLYPSDVFSRASAALGDLAQASCVRLPELENFRLQVPDVTAGGDPDKELAARIGAALHDRPFASRTEKQWFYDRAADELETIRIATMAGYILLVDDVCKFMISKGIWFQARGSAGGSAVTMLLGITQVSPRRWKLFMERFMSKDRTRPPDIDLDVEHLRRDEVIAWLRSRFAVQQVGSYTQYSLTDDEDVEEDDSKGSLMRRYFTSSNKRGVKINDWRDIPRADQQMLRSLGGMKLVSGYGTHAAGFIVAPDETALSQLPLVWLANPKKFNTAFDKKGVEALGFCKLDLLGLRNLTARRITLEAICDNDIELRTPRAIWDDIPDRDPEVSKRLAKGLTAGVFQLDGKTNTRGAKEMKPKSIDDVVAMQALYRPALLQARDDKLYLARRAGEQEVPQRHKDIMDVTGETYGILLYQEQIISLLRAAGMPPDELTDTLDAVKASNAATAKAREFFDKTLPRINQLVADRGWGAMDMDWFLGGLKGYAEYSFNKAHSAQYGEAAWRSAWLAAHYPTEFWLGVLTAYQDHKRIKGFVMSARRQGVPVKSPHVNLSGSGFRLEDSPVGRVVRQGLTQIAHIGPVTAKELAVKQPFKSLQDLGERCLASRVSGAKHLAMGKSPLEAGGAVAALFAAGALDGLE